MGWNQCVMLHFSTAVSGGGVVKCEAVISREMKLETEMEMT